MCVASSKAKQVVDAQRNEQYTIGAIRTDDTFQRWFGAFHRPHETPEDCVVCVQDNTELIFIGIPPEVQRRYLVGECEPVTLLEPGSLKDDLVFFDDHNRSVPLFNFADTGVVVEIREKTRPRVCTARRQRIYELVL